MYEVRIEDYWQGWHIVRQIGQGSFGRVYEIQREDFGQITRSAIKHFSVPQSENETVALFSEGGTREDVSNYYSHLVQNILKEFRIMSELRGNSNIVSYEDHRVIPHSDGLGYDILIKMELLNPFYSYFQNYNVTNEYILRMGVDLCNALELCESKNIIHRDIKPENIFYNDMGVFKLGDFGIAREMEQAMATMSRTGTFNYMAPEVYLNGKYDSTVDIYSLGMVLYKCLNAGKLPFMNDVQAFGIAREQAFSKRINGESLPLPVGCDDNIGAVILKACSFKPKDRYQTASEFRDDLVRCLNGEKSKAFLDSNCRMLSSEDKTETSVKPEVVSEGAFGFQRQNDQSKTDTEKNDNKSIRLESDYKTNGVKTLGKKTDISRKVLLAGIIAGVLSLVVLSSVLIIGLSKKNKKVEEGNEKETITTEAVATEKNSVTTIQTESTTRQTSETETHDEVVETKESDGIAFFIGGLCLFEDGLFGKSYSEVQNYVEENGYGFSLDEPMFWGYEAALNDGVDPDSINLYANWVDVDEYNTYGFYFEDDQLVALVYEDKKSEDIDESIIESAICYFGSEKAWWVFREDEDRLYSMIWEYGADNEFVCDNRGGTFLVSHNYYNHETQGEVHAILQMYTSDRFTQKSLYGGFAEYFEQ